MFIGGVVVRVQRGQVEEVTTRLEAMPGVEIVSTTEEGFALVLEGESVREQRTRHDAIAGWPGVEEALVVFQSNEV